MSVFQQVIARVDLPSCAASATPETPLGEVRGAWTVGEISIVSEAALTAADATARTLTVYNRGQSGSGTTVVGTLVTNTATGNWAANDKKTFTLSATPGALNLADGDALECVETVASTGTARGNCQLSIYGTHA